MSGGRWTEVRVKVAPEWTDLVAAALDALGAGGVEILGRIDGEAAVDWAGPPVVEESGVRAYFPADDLLGERLALLRARLAEARKEVDLPEVEIGLHPVEETGWEEAWKVHYRPVRIGRVVIVPSWWDWPARPEEVVIRLDPGLAFGAGTHPSTQQSLLLLQKAFRPGDRVLDLGTGSGILALAAAALGAPRVLGRDIDPMAVEVARANVKANAGQGRIEIQEGDLLLGLEEKFHLVLANLTAGLHLELLPALPACLYPEGRAVLAGIIRAREEEVSAAAQAAGFKVGERLVDGEWVAVLIYLG